MATALYERVKAPKTTIVEDKRREAIEAAVEYFKPKKVNGVPVCWQGRIVKAMDRAATIPADKQEDYRALVNGLVEKAEEANKRQRDTWLAYVEAANFSAEKVEPIELPQCQCEGCLLIEENNRLIARGAK